MHTINVGILSDNRRLRFALRTLLQEEGKAEIAILLEGLFLHELGSYQQGCTHPDVILLDHKIVYSDENLFFVTFHEFFARSGVVLLVDDAYDGRYTAKVQCLLPQKCTEQLLLSTVRQVAHTPIGTCHNPFPDLSLENI